MAITRTAWIDDDGTGGTGTILLNAEKTSLYDQIDSRWSVITSTSTGTQNNVTLVTGGLEADVFRWNGASAIVITGFVAPASPAKPGKPVIIENITSAQTLRVTNQDAGSTAANRVICESTNGQILGAGGRGLLVYDSTDSRWRFTVLDPGAPIAVAFAAGNFTGSGSMTWTVASGDQTTFRYQQNGKVVTVWFCIETSTVGGTPSTDLNIAIPGGFTNTVQAVNAIAIADAGTGQAGHAQINSGATVIRCLRLPLANWTASTDTTAVLGQITFEVN